MSASIAINNNNTKNNNKNKDKKWKKSGKSVKAVESKKSVPSCDCRAMNRLTSSAPPLSPPLRNKSKCHLSSPTSQSRTSTEEDVIDMPVLTPEVPFEPDAGPPLLNIENNIVKPSSPDLIYADLSAPPVLSPASDLESKSKLGSSCEKSKKRKSKAEPPKGGDGSDGSLYQLSDYNSDSILMSSPKKLKTSPKKSKLFEVNKTKKCNKDILSDKSLKIAKELDESSRKLFKILANKSKARPKFNFKSSPGNESNGWSVNSNHTMSSLNGSMQTSQPFMKCRNLDETNANGMDCAQNESILAHNSSIFDNSFKFRQKLIKKSKTALNSQLMRAESNKGVNKALFNELIGVQKPEPEVDEIEGIRFQSFETEESINLFSKFEQLEKEQKEQSSISKTFGIKSLKSGKLIFPTKTKDITKIKGWREKLFSSLDEKHNKRPIGLSNNLNKIQTNDKTYRSLISNPSIAQCSSSGSKSAFVSDLLEGYLKSKSDLKLNYLSPDFAAPPDDSPIFSASVLKMPEFGVNSMPPPLTPSTSLSLNKKKSVSNDKNKPKAMKNKSTLESILTDSVQSNAEEDIREGLLPQYPVIQETLWPENALSDKEMSRLYDDYIEFTYNEMQQMKRPSAPSLVMDDNYARFALSALQINPKIPYINDSEPTPEDVLMAVGLAPKQKSPSPVKETSKITGRYRKDREADLAKIIAMGNRSKRQIRLPSRFHESSLLMGNQWIIPDYDMKGKTGKRRLQEEQRRLQELHQKQLELEQRKQPLLTTEPNTTTCDDFQLSLIHKKLSNGTKSKLNSLNIPTVSTDYPLKIPHQRLKQIQLIRDQKKQIKTTAKQKMETPKLDKAFTSLFSMSTQSTGDKRVLSLSAKAAASAHQRAQVNQLFLQLSESIHPDKNSMICRNGKLNKLETIKDAIDTIEKLTKREQQLSYIRKLLHMWNHKLQLCSKVAQKDLKPEASKVVNDVMNTYRNSMCYKVGEALEAKRKEFQQKRAQQLAQQNASQSSSSAKKPQLSTNSQVLTIPSAKSTANSFKTPAKAPKHSNQRLILPKLPVLSKSLKTLKPKPETVVSAPSIYPKLTTPDLHHKNVIDSSFDPELIGRESSLLKPPILTTRPTVLKPFIVSSNEGGMHTSTSVTGPVINYPDISKIKSMSKSLNMSNSSSSLIASSKAIGSSSFTSSSINAGTRLKLPFTVPAAVPSTCMSASSGSSIGSKTPNLYSPHSYAGKNVIITSETPLANEDLNRIVASIASNQDFKKVPVRLSNGRAALTIPGTSNMTSSSKGGSIVSTPTITIGSAPALVRNRGNSSEFKEESKYQTKGHKSQASNSSLNLSQSTVSKSNSLQKQTKISERVVSSHSNSTDYIEID